MMLYQFFNLKIQKITSSRYKIELIESPASNGAIERDIVSSFFQKCTELLQNLEQRVITKPQTQELGTLLFDFIFHDQIRDAYLQSRALTDAQGKGLRIRLQIEPPELQFLPWELLYDPQTHRFLATDQTTLLTRCPVDRTDVSRTLQNKLRILVIAPDPLADELELDVKSELESIQTAVKFLKKQKIAIELDILEGKVDFSALQIKLGGDYSIIHYIGHGDFINDASYLRLYDDFTGKNFLKGDKFVKLLENSPVLQLVVLNSCKSARESSAKSLAGIASQLTAAGIPAVIANRNPVRDDFSILFSRIFYGLLGYGFPVDFALNRARLRLLIETSSVPAHEFSSPVGYMVKQNGLLFQFEQFQALNRIYQELSPVEQKIQRVITTQHYHLFGFRIFSVINEQERVYLGKPRIQAMFRVSHTPFCSAVNAPTLTWPAVESVPEYKIILVEIGPNRMGKIIWEGSARSNRIDLTELEIDIKTELNYTWQVSAPKNESGKFYNGLFWLLDQNKFMEYTQLAERIQSELLPGMEQELARCALNFSFGFYDSLLETATHALLKYRDKPASIPFYKCIIETLSEISRRFSKAKMAPSANEIIDYCHFYKSELELIQERLE